MLKVDAPQRPRGDLFPIVQDRLKLRERPQRRHGLLRLDHLVAVRRLPERLRHPRLAYHSNVNGGTHQDSGYAYDGQRAFGPGDAGWLFIFTP